MDGLEVAEEDRHAEVGATWLEGDLELDVVAWGEVEEYQEVEEDLAREGDCREGDE